MTTNNIVFAKKSTQKESEKESKNFSRLKIERREVVLALN